MVMASPVGRSLPLDGVIVQVPHSGAEATSQFRMELGSPALDMVKTPWMVAPGVISSQRSDPSHSRFDPIYG